MPVSRLLISDFLTLKEGLPRPQWKKIGTWIERHFEPAERTLAWTSIAKQWLEELQKVIKQDYLICETDHFLLLAPQIEPSTLLLLDFAEKCRETLLSSMYGVISLQAPGKQVIVCFKNPDIYYRYVSVFYSVGHHGGSSGMQVREGYPHIILCGSDLMQLEQTLSHELTHSSLSGLSLPQWIDEGLAQLFEHDITGRRLLVVNEEMARNHKLFWTKHGLDPFWNGKSFYRADEGQTLSYELAEIFVRILSEDYRPRWFGLKKEPQHLFFDFLRDAKAQDAGEAAAHKHLGLRLGELAARFLGPGNWSPKLKN